MNRPKVNIAALSNLSPEKLVESILREILYLVMTHGPIDENLGICGQIRLELLRAKFSFGSKEADKIKDLFLDLARKWPKYSGDKTFPVPYKCEPSVAFTFLPLWQGEYGDNRRELLKFVIQQICNRRTK